MRAVYCILIAIFCANSAQFAMAESAEDLCKGLLTRPVLISPFYLKSHAYYRDEYYNVTTWKPSQGVGRLIVIEVVKTEQHLPTLLKVAARYPEYFAQFDIYANQKTLVIPDSTRLNSLTKNGVQFKDLVRIFPWSSHYYSDAYFNRMFAKGKILLASRHSEFYHDRMQEHMMGALVMPAWLYQKFVAYDKFKSQVLNLERRKSDKKLKEFLEIESGPTTTAGHYWDTLTSGIGLVIEEMARRGRVTGEDIRKLRDIFYNEGLGFTPGLESYIGRNFIYSWRFTEDKGASVAQEIQKIASQYPTQEITEEKALEEAIRVIYEITKIPLQQLRQLVQD